MPPATVQPRTAIEKRIRRHVIGPVHRFTAVVSPGLETCCARELSEMPSEIEAVHVSAGQVRFMARLDGAFLANRHLRTASRILMHLTEFAATGFARFEQQAADVAWELFLPPDASLRVRATTRRCRLHHTGALAERVDRAVRERLPEIGSASGEARAATQRVFVHGEADRFILSLDTSGELLYKRGLKTHGGRAPIRETLAAGILVLAGYDPALPLVDPMCGSGTFSLEAALMARHLPPGAFRRFAFMEWPAFRPAHWAHLLGAVLPNGQRPETATIFASDIDPAVCAKLAACVAGAGLSDTVQVTVADFFSLSGASFTDRPGLVVLNPPYGYRMDRPDMAQKRLFDIFAKLEKDFTGWRLALVSPDPMTDRRPAGWGTPIRLSHGGLALYLSIGRIG